MSIYTDGGDNGTLTINPGGMSAGSLEIVLPNPACGGDLDLSALWDAIEVRDGGNVVIPALHGRRAYERFRDQVTVDLPFHVVGDCDLDGTAFTPTMLEQLQANVEVLRDNLNTVSPTVTRDAELVLPDGTVLTGPVQTLFRSGLHMGMPPTKPAVLSVTIPLGMLEVEGS